MSKISLKIVATVEAIIRKQKIICSRKDNKVKFFSQNTLAFALGVYPTSKKYSTRNQLLPDAKQNRSRKLKFCFLEKFLFSFIFIKKVTVIR
jgi:hypothetical protein